MRLIAEGKAPRITQPQEGATYECIQKKDNAKVIYKNIQTDQFSALCYPVVKKESQSCLICEGSVDLIHQDTRCFMWMISK